MVDLQQLRSSIDDVDGRILSLILERRRLVAQVAQYKQEHQLPVFAPERENQILERIGEKTAEGIGSIRLLYGILMDINKLLEYQLMPRDIVVPTDLGGASVRAILPDNPGSLCRYISPLAAAEVSIAGIRSHQLPGGKLVVDIELIGETKDPKFIAVLSVLADAAEKFTLL
jgi:chorismate mutase